MNQIIRANVFPYVRVKTEKNPPKPKVNAFFLSFIGRKRGPLVLSFPASVMHALLPQCLVLSSTHSQQKQIEFQLARSLILYHANAVQATERACLCLNKTRA